MAASRSVRQRQSPVAESTDVINVEMKIKNVKNVEKIKKTFVNVG